MKDQRNMSEKVFDQKFEELKKNGINTENIAFKTEDDLVAFCEENGLFTV